MHLISIVAGAGATPVSKEQTDYDAMVKRERGLITKEQEKYAEAQAHFQATTTLEKIGRELASLTEKRDREKKIDELYSGFLAHMGWLKHWSRDGQSWIFLQRNYWEKMENETMEQRTKRVRMIKKANISSIMTKSGFEEALVYDEMYTMFKNDGKKSTH